MVLGIHGGSGEPANPYSENTSTYEGTVITSEVRSYLDPPIENYRNVYGFGRRSPCNSKISSNNRSPQNA